MKKIVLLVGLIVSCQCLFAQTFAEWFAQKKTQIKYLGDQIAALQVYAGYLQKGYHIAENGLSAISDIKNGEFNLHKNYFGSLKNVNPVIAKDARIAAIIALQVNIVEQYKKTYTKVLHNNAFNSAQVNYIYAVFTNLLNDCINDIAEMISLTTSGELQLTDKERIQRIDGLYTDMLDKYSFSKSFSNETNIMALSVTKDQNDAAMLKHLYNIK